MAKRTPPTHPTARRQLEALGDRLRAARLRRGMTQAMLAERVGVHVQTLIKLESGTPTTSLATMLRVLQALGFVRDIDAIAADERTADPGQPPSAGGAPTAGGPVKVSREMTPDQLCAVASMVTH